MLLASRWGRRRCGREQGAAISEDSEVAPGRRPPSTIRLGRVHLAAARITVCFVQLGKSVGSCLMYGRTDPTHPAKGKPPLGFLNALTGGYIFLDSAFHATV